MYERRRRNRTRGGRIGEERKGKKEKKEGKYRGRREIEKIE